MEPVPIAAVRRGLGAALRSRVAGPDAATEAARIWSTPGPRWFTPDDPIWRVHNDASMFAGGIGALLLQSLHPQAMAGVAGHSGYRSDPWGRLQRTSRYLAVTTYGTIEHAREAIAQVAGVHERVRGKDDAGTPYRASDPHLLRWVHVAEIWMFLRSHQRYGSLRLNPDEADRYVEQTAIPAGLLGAEDLPRTVAELDEAIESYRAELRVIEAARDSARFLLLEPPVPIALRPGYWMLAMGGIRLLPRWARRPLRLPAIGPARAVESAAGQVSTATVRWAMTAVRRAEAVEAPAPSR